MYYLVVYVRNGKLEQSAFLQNRKMQAFDFAVQHKGWVVVAHELVTQPSKNTEYRVWKG